MQSDVIIEKYRQVCIFLLDGKEIAIKIGKQSAKERLVETADRLFYAEGVRAVGIDRIIAEADVAKTTLYKYFRSKEDLVDACLVRRDVAIRAWIDSYLSTQGDDPTEQILAVFDFLDLWFSMDDFHGCAFTNASLGLHGSFSVVHETVARHKTAVLALFQRLTERAGAADAATLSEQLMFLYEGAVVSVLVRPAPSAARHAKAAAATLIAAAMP